jgi:uncharacterized protein YcsI (UPF0317 family)
VYRTNIPTGRRAYFMVCGDCPCAHFWPKDAIRAVQVTSRFPSIATRRCTWSDPSLIGVAISESDYGDAIEIKTGNCPCFLGLRRQTLIQARPVCITLCPGAMLI